MTYHDYNTNQSPSDAQYNFNQQNQACGSFPTITSEPSKTHLDTSEDQLSLTVSLLRSLKEDYIVLKVLVFNFHAPRTIKDSITVCTFKTYKLLFHAYRKP